MPPYIYRCPNGHDTELLHNTCNCGAVEIKRLPCEKCGLDAVRVETK